MPHLLIHCFRRAERQNFLLDQQRAAERVNHRAWERTHEETSETTAVDT